MSQKRNLANKIPWQ